MSINIEDLMAGIEKTTGQKIQRVNTKRLDENTLHEYAVHALDTLRGLPRGDKLKIINRMRKLL